MPILNINLQTKKTFTKLGVITVVAQIRNTEQSIEVGSNLELISHF